MVRWSYKAQLLSSVALLSGCGGAYNISAIAPDVVVVERDVMVDPDAEEFRPTAKLIFIVDNSSSMKDEQTLLANGITSTFDQLRGYNLDIQVYTTSSSDAAISASRTSVKVDKFRDEGDGVFAIDESGGADLDPNVVRHNYSKKRSFQLKSVNPAGNPIELRRTMSADEIATVKQSLVSVISTIGADGSDVESGYCSMIRAMIKKEGEDPLLRSGDRVALVMISDDNDYSAIAECTAEEVDLYRWLPPVSATRGVAVNAENLNFYSYATGWGPRERLQLDINYTDANNLQPTWLVNSTFAKTEIVSINYTYKTDVNNDGQISEVTLTKNDHQFVFDPALLQNPPLGSGSQNCTSNLLDWVKAQSLLGRNQNISSCTYRYDVGNASQSLTAALEGMGTQSNTIACSSVTASALNSASASYSTLIPTGKRFISCTYSYRSATGRSKTVFLLDTPDGVNFVGANISCGSNANLRSFADHRILTAVNSTESPSVTGCTLRSRAATKACNFDDVRLESLAPGSTALDLPDQCANTTLSSYVLSPRTSCTGAQLNGLINYSCTRTPKTSATESYYSQGPRFQLDSAGSSRKSALTVLEQRLEIASNSSQSDELRLIYAVKEGSRKLFGQSGFFFSAIVKPTDVGGCPGQLPGGGERYRSFAQALGSMGYIQSICAASYAPALENISNFIVRVLNNSYSIKLKETEEIIGITVQRGDQIIVLKLGEEYTAIGGTMNFMPDVLELGDKMEVRVRDTFEVRAKLD